ncbi:MAG: CDP-diacylglycerol--glycerol-3-phosphate 3-phosphatidyltransferase [Proteobacteria bacterium]|nr:CDP-diacylglycerol--glycerol-3-phosphate 3-phosphatidyltransferase [Pseudomonadota bacterium]
MGAVGSVQSQGDTSATTSAEAKAAPDSASDAVHEPTHFWNLPNTITMLRISIVPVMLLIPFATGKGASQAIAWCYIVAAASDVLDGWLARRGGQVSKVGKLLDPLADKLLVTTALVMLLVAEDRLPVWTAWMVVVIIGRELAVTGLRGIASADGQVMAASNLGKWKAVAQNVAIGALLFHYTTLGLPAHEIGIFFLAVATALTLWSGYVYFAQYFGWRGSTTGDPADASSEESRA